MHESKGQHIGKATLCNMLHVGTCETAANSVKESHMCLHD